MSKKNFFNDRYGLTEAVLERWKTMTRRVDKKLNHPLVTHISEWGIDGKGKAYVTITYSTGLTEDVYPAYQIGEEVAVAQSYSRIYNHMLFYAGKEKALAYRSKLGSEPELQAGWQNKMFVRADLMQHRIRITDIRVERLQDISDEDCLREGIYKHNALPDALGEDRYKFISYAYDATQDKHRKRKWFPTPREAFAALIDKISGKGTWERNPWVFVYEFELVK